MVNTEELTEVPQTTLRENPPRGLVVYIPDEVEKELQKLFEEAGVSEDDSGVWAY